MKIQGLMIVDRKKIKTTKEHIGSLLRDIEYLLLNPETEKRDIIHKRIKEKSIKIRIDLNNL